MRHQTGTNLSCLPFFNRAKDAYGFFFLFLFFFVAYLRLSPHRSLMNEAPRVAEMTRCAYFVVKVFCGEGAPAFIGCGCQAKQRKCLLCDHGCPAFCWPPNKRVEAIFLKELYGLQVNNTTG